MRFGVLKSVDQMAHSATKKEHYEFEKTIAARLRESSAAERATLYGWAYDAIYSKVPGTAGRGGARAIRIYRRRSPCWATLYATIRSM